MSTQLSQIAKKAKLDRKAVAEENRASYVATRCRRRVCREV